MFQGTDSVFDIETVSSNISSGVEKLKTMIGARKCLWSEERK